MTDWDGDGQLDLLMGDYCGGFESKPTQTEAETREELKSVQSLPKLRSQWAQKFSEFRALPKSGSPESTGKRSALLREIKTLKEQIAASQSITQKYKPQRQAHGFVWLVKRRPKE